MIGTKNLRVETYDLNSLTVRWEYKHIPPNVNLSTTTLSVHRSESEDFSSYDIIKGGLVASTTNEYTDSLLSGVVTRRYNNVNYRLEFLESDGTKTTTDFVWLITPINLKAKDIIRRKALSLREFGLPMYFLKRKTFGEPCTVCYDEILDQQLASACTTCFDTGFIGGYHAAIPFKAFITQTPSINQINIFGEINPGQAIISTHSFPKLSMNDVIVDQLNRRWWVVRVNPISLQGYIISQDTITNLADHNEIIYSKSL